MNCTTSVVAFIQSALGEVMSVGRLATLVQIEITQPPYGLT